MINKKKLFPRGAEWRKWDLHIHTPASFEWGGQRFTKNEEEKKKQIDVMIASLNESDAEVFAIMDYWTFDGWIELQKRLLDNGSPKLHKTIFPGIELRLQSPTKYRLNAHVILSDNISNQELNNFKTQLNVALINEPLSNECLIKLAREKTNKDWMDKNGYKQEDVARDDDIALLVGSKVAEITVESYKKAIKKVPNGKAISFIPWDTYNGLADADWVEHYSSVMDLMTTSQIFESRKQSIRDAFVGIKTQENGKWFDQFQIALNNKPPLVVAGSDAHRFSDYAKFPSNKATWIKSDPTFLGLLQAIKEPAKRSHIGEQRPKKVEEVEGNKTYFIDSIKIDKTTNTIAGEWLSGCDLALNHDLIAVIGNKGSGKSALADTIALLGNSRQKEHFSFLSNKRFRAKSNELAKHFTGKITWRDQALGVPRALSSDPEDGSVELVRYIPQAHFERLCNEHISGNSDVFENELRTVIFSHTSEAMRQKASDFDQLTQQQESGYRDQLNEYRKDLKRINQKIGSIESQLQLKNIQLLEERLKLKEKQIEEHKKNIPSPLPQPTESLTLEQKQISSNLEEVMESIKGLDKKALEFAKSEIGLVAKIKAIQTIKDRLLILRRQYDKFEDDSKDDFLTIELELAQVLSFNINEQNLEKLSIKTKEDQSILSKNILENKKNRQDFIIKQSDLKAKLDEPQQAYQQNLKLIETWKEKLAELTGSQNLPETLEGIRAQISKIKNLPNELTEEQTKRINLAGDIFDILDKQRKSREELFEPVQKLIQENSLIREDYKLQFQATLATSSEVISSSLFELIKQSSGKFRGEDNGRALIKSIYEKHDMNDKSQVLNFISEIYEEIVASAKNIDKDSVGIGNVLRINKAASDVYDYLFGLSFVEPRYTLLFQDTGIEQLSPGQRGALLLIFYLLVDKGRKPIILDQPEENLDNETVVNLLVPVLNQAKERRQIIMVTHNPNLAVVCDAEQIIYSSFDRKNNSKINYVSGSIENPTINQHVVNVLEGTKIAFDNRGDKYLHSEKIRK